MPASKPGIPKAAQAPTLHEGRWPEQFYKRLGRDIPLTKWLMPFGLAYSNSWDQRPQYGHGEYRQENQEHDSCHSPYGVT